MVKLRVNKPFEGQSGGSTIKFREGRVVHTTDEHLARTLIDSGVATQELHLGESPLEMDDATAAYVDLIKKKARETILKMEAAADRHMALSAQMVQQYKDVAERDRAMLRAAEKQIEELNQDLRNLKLRLESLPQTWQERLLADDDGA